MERRTVRRNGTRIAGAVMAAALLACGTVLGAGPGEVEQTIQLHPGWNAVYLEVQPDPSDIEAVLAGVPVASVWTLKAGTETIQYVRDPNEKTLRTDGWYGYFPPSRPEHVTTNLFTFRAGQTYLIRLEGEVPVMWRVCGRPGMKTVRWLPDSYNLVGFDVDPQAPPTLGEWFKPSAAHDGQPIWEMTADGSWREVTDPYSTTIRAGAAYWVYCQGKSDYQGPLVVRPELLEGLDFGKAVRTLGLNIENALDIDVDVTITRQNPGDVPLVVEVMDPETVKRSYPDVPAAYRIEVGAGKGARLDFGVRRARLAALEAADVLSVSNGLGCRRLVWVHVQSVYQPVLKSARDASTPFSGLWVGIARVNKVSMAQEGGTTPKPTKSSYPLRFLLHVDASGQVRLLKEVTKMWKEGTTKPDPGGSGYNVTDQPGHYVLVTDESLFDQFKGVEFNGDAVVPVRISTIAYDFQGTELEAQGTIGPRGNLDATLVLPVGFPTNPFFDRYHPDHDNLDAEFLNFKAESYEITRRIHWRFTETDPWGIDDPNWGHTILGGVYSEEITGLHRNPIFVEGTFRMELVSPIPVLNQ